MSEWKKLEALLFASGKYLTEEQLITLSGIPKNKIKKTLSELTKIYEERDTSLAIYNEGDAWKLNVKEEYTDVIREVVSDAEMPRAVMETLAIIAYKNPVLQSEIKDIRGTSVYDHIPLLEAKGFITRDKHGRSYKIKLTNKFHEYFDIDGEMKLAELFKDIKKPEAPTKIGTLDVYTATENDDKFNAQILERMKKLEKTDEDHKNETNFLSEFEEKFEKTKKNIDESEQDIETFRKNPEDESSNMNSESSDETEGAETKDTEPDKDKNYDDETYEDETDKDDIHKVKNSSDEEDETTAETDAEIIHKEDLFDEDGEPVPDFVDKINHQIDDMTKDQKVTKEMLNSSVDNTDDDVNENNEDDEDDNNNEDDEDDDTESSIKKDASVDSDDGSNLESDEVDSELNKN